MAITAKRARELALALENTTEAPHFDRIAFRTPRRIFATLARAGGDLNFMFDHEQQAHFCALAPAAMSPVPGGWGRMGATRCDLKAVDGATFNAALKASHARADATRPKATRPQDAAPKIAPFLGSGWRLEYKLGWRQIHSKFRTGNETLGNERDFSRM